MLIANGVIEGVEDPVVVNEFFALDHGLRSHPQPEVPAQDSNSDRADASAIHGRPGAQVALLQSPIPRTAGPR